MDTDVKNISGYDDINPLVQPFLEGDRAARPRQLRRRASGSTGRPAARASVHGGYGIYYDRVTLQIMSLERGLDGRALPIEVRAGNVFFLDPDDRPAPALRADARRTPSPGSSSPARAPPASTSSTTPSEPEVQQWNLGAERQLGRRRLPARRRRPQRRHALHHRPHASARCSTRSSAGPTASSTSSRASAREYKALLVSLEQARRAPPLPRVVHAGKADNYANDDQIPFASGPIDPNDLEREFGPTPERPPPPASRFAGSFALPAEFLVAPLFTLVLRGPDGHPDARRAAARAGPSSATPAGAHFDDAAELNAFLTRPQRARRRRRRAAAARERRRAVQRRFSSLDLRVSRRVRRRRTVSPSSAMVEVFNLFDIDEHPGHVQPQLLGLLERAGPRLRRPGDPGLPARRRASARR